MPGINKRTLVCLNTNNQGKTKLHKEKKNLLFASAISISIQKIGSRREDGLTDNKHILGTREQSIELYYTVAKLNRTMKHCKITYREIYLNYL